MKSSTSLIFFECYKKAKSNRGFSIVELLLVVSIVGILAAISYPAYTSYTKKAYRADGMSAVMQAASALERFRTTNNVYTGATFGAGGIFSDTTPLDGGTTTYTLSLVVTDNTYTITAAPEGPLVGDWTLELDHTGQKSRTGGGPTINDWNIKGDP